MKNADLIVYNIGRLHTCASPTPKRGDALRDLGTLTDAAIAIADEKIVAVGDSAEILATYQSPYILNARGNAVIPAFVDCHTHIVYGGDRAHEFEMRLAGASYMEIMAAGGGIVSTMRDTRTASPDELLMSAAHRANMMTQLGSTTIEVKTGYGLDVASELKMLHAIERLDEIQTCRFVPTFLGAHTLPPEYKDDPTSYVDLVITEMIPAVWEWYAQSRFAAQGTPFFIDVFCEDHAFDVEQSRRILEAGIAAGMQAKIHVDQFNSLGGLEMAIALGAISADHLEATVPADIPKLAASDTIAVLMPVVNFNLGLTTFADGRALIDAGAAVALATDMNPGSAPCFSMLLTMAIACRYMRLTPTEALNAATINAAHALGLGDQVGSIEVGKSADLILLNSPDYRNLSYLLGNDSIETLIRGDILFGRSDD